MPLPTFDSKDAVPEPFREAYVERDGKWVPDDSEVAGLKHSQRRLLNEKKQVETSLAEILGDRSIDDVKALVAKASDEPTPKPDKSADASRWAEREKKLRDEFDAKLNPLLDKARKLEQKEFEEAVWEAARGAGANESHRKMVLKMAKDDYVKSDGGKIVVLDEYGDATEDSLKALFEGRFKKENAMLYAPQGGSGGGATAGGASVQRGNANTAPSISEFVTTITGNKDALAKAKAGQYGVRE